MATVGNGAQGSAIIAQDSAVIDNSSYFSDKVQEGFSMVDATLREALTLLVRIAGTDKEDEQKSLLGQLYGLQEENNELVKQIFLKLPEGGLGVVTYQDGNELDISTILGDISSMTTIAQYLKETGFLEAATIAASQSGKAITVAGSQAGKAAMAVGSQAGQAAMSLAAQYLVPFLTTYGLPIVAAALAAGGVYYLATHNPDWVTVESEEERNDRHERYRDGKLNAQDFIKTYGGDNNSIARDKFLDYLFANDDDLYRKEMAIAPRGYTFADAERMGIEKGLLDSPNVQPDSNIISDWQEKGLVPSIKTPSQIMISQFSELSSTTNVPNAPTIKRKPSVANGEGLAEPSLSQKIANPLTGAGEGVIDALRAGNASPYQMDGPGVNPNSTLGVQDGFPERLAAALERLAEVCALPRVSVGTLAETAVVREEADLDTLARRFADDLLHAQLVS